jgi:magnesium transporter
LVVPRFLRRVTSKIGLPPGALVPTGERRMERVKVRLVDYDRDRLEERELSTIEESFPYRDTPSITWINVDGIHDAEVMEKIGRHFGIHSLVLEDVLSIGQRPKTEDFDDYIFLVLKMLLYQEESEEVRAEQVSLILGRNFVISFQEIEGDVFNAVRERIRLSKGRIRRAGADYLAYALLDAVVDGYFVILERLGERIEELEDRLLADPGPETLRDIYTLKREMIFLRKSVWPLRELLSGLERTESDLIDKSTVIYLRDVYDHTIQVMDTVESFRDMASGMLDTYLSSVSNRMNEVMKVLTIIATIFIPVTFIAGVYGMNFDHMPELHWRFSYFGALGAMGLVALVMVIYFRRKGWF